MYLVAADEIKNVRVTVLAVEKFEGAENTEDTVFDEFIIMEAVDTDIAVLATEDIEEEIDYAGHHRHQRIDQD